MYPTDNIGYLLQHLAFTIARQNDQELQDRLGIGFSQFKILIVLHQNPNTQQRDIADALGQTEASVSRQIKLMHDQGLLQTQIDNQNRRKHLTTLTAKGQKLTEEALRILNSYHAPMFERLPEHQQQQLLEAMTSMHEYACQSGKAGACGRPFSA
jgi:DNA-binding MarR family transcriptional regulator